MKSVVVLVVSTILTCWWCSLTCRVDDLFSPVLLLWCLSVLSVQCRWYDWCGWDQRTQVSCCCCCCYYYSANMPFFELSVLCFSSWTNDVSVVVFVYFVVYNLSFIK